MSSILRGASCFGSSPVALAVAVGLLVAGPAKADDPAVELSRTRKEIERLTALIRRLSLDQASLDQEIRKSELARQLAEKRVQEAMAEREEAVCRREEAGRDAKDAGNKLDGARARLADQARLAARVGPPSLLRYILLADSAKDLYFGFELMGFLVRRSADLARELNRLRVESLRLGREASERAELATLAAAKSRLRRQEEAAVRDHAKRLLGSIMGDRESRERLLSEQVAKAKRLTGLLERVGRQAQRAILVAAGILPMRGYLPWPVDGRLTRRFGRYRDKRYGIEHRSNGIEIAAKDGTPVKTIFPGRVVYADWFRGYGNMVIVDHGDKVYSLYAHLRESVVKVGDELPASAVLGTILNAKSLTGEGLLFEIRRGTQAVDPLEWIVRTER